MNDAQRVYAYKQEEETLKLFSLVQVGRDYEWINAVGDRHVLRVDSKRMTLGKELKVEVSGIFFYIDETGEPRGEGFPSYADVWNQVFSLSGNFKLWEGTRPNRQPIHAEYFCDDCGDTISEKAPHDLLSPCCQETVRCKRIYKGEHDDSCLCEDCK